MTCNTYVSKIDPQNITIWIGVDPIFYALDITLDSILENITNGT